VLHQQGTSIVLARPPRALGPVSYEVHQSTLSSASVVLSAQARFEPSRDMMESGLVSVKPDRLAPGTYDVPTTFDRTGRTLPLSPLGNERAALYVQKFPRSRREVRFEPRRKDPISAPSPNRYAPLSRVDTINIAGPSALPLEGHAAQTRNALTSNRASGLGSIRATLTFGAATAQVRPPMPISPRSPVSRNSPVLGSPSSGSHVQASTLRSASMHSD
jgi:hypothetical protein